MTIDIIGAGIGGLTTAIAIEQKGLKVRLYEQAEEIKPVGAGIILANNAMQVYEKLGLRKAIEANGNRISSIKLTKPNLDPFSTVDLSYFEAKHHVKNIAIHRGTLQQILIEQLRSTEIKLDHRLAKIEASSSGYSLTFGNQVNIHSSAVIGADGINSVVRQTLFPNNTIRNARQICWRGVTDLDLPVKYQSELNEAWGKTGRFGFVQIAENRVYWYALKSFRNSRDEYPLNDIEKYFQYFDPVIKAILASTEKSKIYTAEITDLRPTDIWHKDHLCLIGDAAHATTPNMGQGACQAIEDAYVLAECLNKYNIPTAFEEFQKIRLPKAHQVVKASWMLGKIAHLSNPILIGLRNQMMKMTPSSIRRKQSEQIFQLPHLGG